MHTFSWRKYDDFNSIWIFEAMDNFSLFNCQRHDPVSLQLLRSVSRPMYPVSSRANVFVCRSVLESGGGAGTAVLNSAAVVLTRYDFL